MYKHMHDDNWEICMMIMHLYASICIDMMILQVLLLYILKQESHEAYSTADKVL